MSDLGIVKHIKEMFYHKKWKFTLNFVIQYLKCGKTEETKKFLFSHNPIFILFPFFHLLNLRKASTWLEVWKSFKFILDSSFSLQTFPKHFFKTLLWKWDSAYLSFRFLFQRKKFGFFMASFRKLYFFLFLICYIFRRQVL